MSSGTDFSDRHVPLEGCLNLRDLGGYATADGRQVGRGSVFRSSELCSLTDADLDTMAALGISVVFDLRAAAEREARPNRLPPGVEVHVRATPSNWPHAPETLEDQVVAGSLPERDDELVTATYIRQLDGGLVPEFHRILELALDAAARPLLFHCAAGKDRTGLMAAILLGVLGVPDETILLDYELTTTHWAAPRLSGLRELMAEHGVTEAQVLPLLEARSVCMRQTLSHLHERWGGFERYVVDGLELGRTFPERLRAALLEPGELLEPGDR